MQTKRQQTRGLAPNPIITWRNDSTTSNNHTSAWLVKPKRVLSPRSRPPQWALVSPRRLLARRWVVGGDEDSGDDREKASGHAESEGPAVGETVATPGDEGEVQIAQRPEKGEHC